MLRLDEEINFIPITYDRIFKSIFTTDKKLLKEFLFSQFDFDMDIDKCKIKILNSELPVNTYYEYQKTADIIVRIEDNTFINLEVNREHFKEVEDRNSLFADKIRQLIIEKGETYKDIKKKLFIQLNLNAVDKLDENYQKIKYGTDEVISY